MQIYDIYKRNYIKIAKIDKSTKRGKLISNEYENIVYAEIDNNFSKNIDLKNLYHFDYSSPIQNIFTNNENYVDLQIKKSNIYNSSIEYVKFYSNKTI